LASLFAAGLRAIGALGSGDWSQGNTYSDFRKAFVQAIDQQAFRSRPPTQPSRGATLTIWLAEERRSPSRGAPCAGNALVIELSVDLFKKQIGRAHPDGEIRQSFTDILQSSECVGGV
jgi:hypothetical protein